MLERSETTVGSMMNAAQRRARFINKLASLDLTEEGWTVYMALYDQDIQAAVREERERIRDVLVKKSRLFRAKDLNVMMYVDWAKVEEALTNEKEG